MTKKEQLTESVRHTLLDIIEESRVLKRKLTFREHFGLYKAVKHLPSEKVLELAILLERKRGQPPAKPISAIADILAKGFAVAVCLPLLHPAIPGGTLLFYAAVRYLHDLHNWKCEAACQSGEYGKEIKDKRLCYAMCDLASWNKVLTELEIERKTCPVQKNPKLCEKRMSKLILYATQKKAEAEARVQIRRMKARYKKT